MPPLVKILLCVVLVGLLMVWTAERDPMMRRMGWGVAVVGALWLIVLALGGGA